MALNQAKLKNVMLFIATNNNVSDLGITKLYKLVYFADAACLRETGQTITGSDYIKFQHGPVPSRGEKIIKLLRREGAIQLQQREHFNMRLEEVLPKREADTSVFSESEIKILEEICKTKGKETAASLSDESHQEPAWIYADMLEKLSPSLMHYGTSEDPDGL